MKVLVVSNGYPPRGRFGTEFYTKELVHGLRHQGDEVRVLHPVRAGERPRYTVEEVEEEGVRVALLHNPGDPGRRFEPSYVDENVEQVFRAQLERYRPDVVHFLYLLWGLSARLPLVAQELGIPTVVTLTDYGLICHRGQMYDHRLQACGGPHPPTTCARCIREPAPFDDPPWKLGLKRTAVRALAATGGWGQVVTADDVARREEVVREVFDAVAQWIAPTAVLAEAFQRAGLAADRITELVYSFDEGPYQDLPRPAGSQQTFGFVGQFAPHKGFDTLIAAADVLARRISAPWEIALYGGPSQGRHRLFGPRFLERRNPDRVRLAPAFSPEEAPRVLAGFRALVVPSTWDENAPLAVLQARAAGVRIVASDVAGIREVVGEEHGRLVPPGDAEALAAALEAELRAQPACPPGLPLALTPHLERVRGLYRKVGV